MKPKSQIIAASLKLHAISLLLALCPLQFSLAQQYGWLDLSDNIPTQVGNANLTDVAAVGASVWIASSNLKGVFRSEDGGETFVFDTLNVGIQGLYRFPDGQRGWAVGGAWGFKTLDGGLNWTPVFIGSTLLSVTFANDNTGYATGLGSVYRTDDAGTTWIKQSEIANLFNRDVMDASFPDPQNPLSGFVCVANEISTIFQTDDGGQNWDNVTLSWVTSSVNDLDMISPGIGYAVGGDANIFKFENNIWTFQTTPFNENLNGVSMTPDGLDVWTVGNNGTILFHENNGSWVQQAVGLTDSYLASVDAVSNTEAYAVGMDKTFLKFTLLEGLPGGSEAGKQGSLEVFPNPGRGVYNLHFSVYNLESVWVEVVDLYGKVVQEIVCDFEFGAGLECGACNLEFDITRCPAGIYFIRISLENQSIVKKLIKL